MPQAPLQLLRSWLEPRLAAPARGWLEAQLDRLSGDFSDRDLYLAISLVPRKLGKDDLALSDDELAAASAARPGWDLREWSVDQAARVALLLTGDGDAGRFAARLEQLFATADLAELVTFYRGLPLYPEQPRYVRRAGEGARSNMKAVFEAVAHRNPYPAEQFDELAWNHLVLKALFIGSALHPIQALDERANPSLARMLLDYAHERWAAGRAVSPELWRCVGPYADAAALADLERVMRGGTATERAAAALALARSGHPEAAQVLRRYPDYAAQIQRGELSWSRLPAGH